MNVKVFGHNRLIQFGYEYKGKLIYESGQFFVIEYTHPWSHKLIRHTFHCSTHGYEEEFVAPFAVGSCVHMTHKKCRDNASFQDNPCLVYDYVKTGKGWAIEIGKFGCGKKYESSYLLSDYDIIQIPQDVINVYANGV